MLEFETIQELKLNAEILDLIKTYDYTVKICKIKHLMATNLNVVKPI